VPGKKQKHPHELQLKSPLGERERSYDQRGEGRRARAFHTAREIPSKTPVDRRSTRTRFQLGPFFIGPPVQMDPSGSVECPPLNPPGGGEARSRRISRAQLNQSTASDLLSRFEQLSVDNCQAKQQIESCCDRAIGLAIVPECDNQEYGLPGTIKGRWVTYIFVPISCRLSLLLFQTTKT
jgi:hypothetical protein